MKTYFLVVTLIIATCSSSVAQSKLTEKQKNEMRIRWEKYQEKLNLTTEQSEKVKAVNQSFFDKMVTLRETAGSKLQKYRTYKTIKSEKDQKMKEILLPEQYQTYLDFQDQVKDEFMEQRKSRK